MITNREVPPSEMGYRTVLANNHRLGKTSCYRYSILIFFTTYSTVQTW
jgi:hypothetical protein